MLIIQQAFGMYGILSTSYAVFWRGVQIPSILHSSLEVRKYLRNYFVDTIKIACDDMNRRGNVVAQLTRWTAAQGKITCNEEVPVQILLEMLPWWKW